MNSEFSFFDQHVLAIKEILQNGAVVGGDKSECLVKIYMDEQGKYHLLVANTADEAADLQEMLNYNDSQHEAISNYGGVGLKAALSTMYQFDCGRFKIATRYGDGRIGYKAAPFNSIRMPIKEDFSWPVDQKYVTYVDTEIFKFEKYKDTLSLESLARDLGTLFGFRIERGMTLELDILGEKIEKVQPNLPHKPSETQERKWTRRQDPEGDEPDLIVNHRQMDNERTILRKDIDGKEYETTVIFNVEDREYEGKDGPWGQKEANQGAWLVLDGVIQSYIGVDIFGLESHSSMNGKYTFIEYTDIQNGYFDGLTSQMFSPSKTGINTENEIVEDLYAFFAEPEQAEDRKRNRGNSISEWYRWLSEEDNEEQVREERDYIYQKFALQETQNGIQTRYVKDFKNHEGNTYDGVILRATEKGIKINTIVEYRKSPVTVEDVREIVRYIKDELMHMNIISHLVLAAPTIEKNALEKIVEEIALASDRYGLIKNVIGSISLYLFNDEYDRSENEVYSKEKLNRYIDEETFNMLKNANQFWTTRNGGGNATQTEIEYNQDYNIFGSAPISCLYAEEIKKCEERNRRLELEWIFKDIAMDKLEEEAMRLRKEIHSLGISDVEKSNTLMRRLQEINEFLALKGNE